jgi:hypothetical protein
MNIPAFPAPAGVSHITEQGMTLRDYFAAKAMQTMVSHRRTQCETDNDDYSDWDEFFPIIAQESYWIADAMLKAREA